MIFNSLGSNYSYKFARRFLKARGASQASKELEVFLAEKYGGAAFLYYRGRAALSEAIRLCGVDYVLVNGFTCYAVEQAIRGAGSRPVFADVSRKTYHFTLKELKKAHQAQPAVGAVIIQNTFGIGDKIKPIVNYCKRHDLVLIEDLAHSPDNHYLDDEAFGMVGDFVILSFGNSKQIDAVGGGALIVRNQIFIDQVVKPRPLAGFWRLRLTERLQPLIACWLRFCYRQPNFGALVHGLFVRLGLVQRTNDGGLFSNFSLPSPRSPLVLEQWQRLAAEKKRRLQLMSIYDQILEMDNVFLKQQALLRYPILLASNEIKDFLLQKLYAHGFCLADHWYDSMTYPARFSKFSDYKEGSCPQKEKIIQQIVNLPLHKHISQSQARDLAQLVAPFKYLSFRDNYDRETWHESWQTFEADHTNLLTSWQELEAYSDLGHKVYRFGLYYKQEIVALVGAVVINARRGRFLRVPGGPLLNPEHADLQALALEKLRRIALKEKCVCLRLQPFLFDTPQNRQMMRSLNFRPSPLNANAPNTLKIDLNQPYENILASKLYRNTRNCINKARSLNLRVIENNTKAGLEDFLNMLRQTAEIQGFKPNDFDFIRAQFTTYRQAQKLHIYHVLNSLEAENADTILASAIIIDHGFESTYLYGASSVLGQSLRAPYLLQAQIIQDAQARGMKTYNLWGVAPKDAPANHHFQGLTVFKKSFTKEYFAYLPSHDLVLARGRYAALYMLESYERKRKHL